MFRRLYLKATLHGSKTRTRGPVVLYPTKVNVVEANGTREVGMIMGFDDDDRISVSPEPETRLLKARVESSTVIVEAWDLNIGYVFAVMAVRGDVTDSNVVADSVICVIVSTVATTGMPPFPVAVGL